MSSGFLSGRIRRALGRLTGRRARDRRLKATAVIAAAAMAASVVGGPAAVAGTQRGHAPQASAGSPVPVSKVAGRTVSVPKMTPAPKPSATWPSAGSVTVALGAADPAAGGQASANVASAAPSAGSVRAGSLPVWVGRPDTQAPAASGSSPSADAAPVTEARVAVASQATAKALGIKGVVVSVARADGDPATGRIHVSISYSEFADAYGGDYGSRLELVEMPACAVSTPTLASCRGENPVGSLNDARSHVTGADVTLPAATATTAATTPHAVLALVAAPSGSGGNFAAEPMSEATDDWVTGDDSGAYTYSYPISVPPVPGGLEPSVGMDYDSATTMGLTSSTNNEASWIGDGWNYSPGFIEQDYSTCGSLPNEPATGDLCPSGGQVTMSLNGVVTPLVDGANGWRAEVDGGATVRRSGAGWEVILPNGVQYYFGLDELPGYTSGDATTNSQWTVPVWEGCGQAAFCALPWRDMLDYVVDPHGDAIAYTYSAQTNSYAEQDGTTATGTYTQGGALTGIAYGFRAGRYYSSTPTATVSFTLATTRQDAPTDLSCASGATCAVTAPTFWNTDELTGVSTQALENGAYTSVDSWSLSGSYPATGDVTTSPSLWLDSITRTGRDGSTPITLPAVAFSGTAEPNRVVTAADTAAGYSAITRFYLSSVTNQTGGVVSVAYSAPYSSGTFPSPSANATTVYPDYWDPVGSGTPVLDWFNTYAVSSMTKLDTTGGDPPVVTAYTYADPGWHYDEDTVSRSATVTWDQWRGYQTVTTETGTAPDPVTENVDLYLQGMSQDGPANDTGPVVTVPTSQGLKVTDSDQFAGMLLESTVYDGAGSGQIVTDTVDVDVPWTSAATAVDTTLDQAAYLTGTANDELYTPLAGGGERESVQSYTFTSDGLTASDSDVPDTTNSSESTCTTNTYAANTATALLDLPSTVTTDAGVCNASGNGTGSLVSETEYYYDGGSLGAAPTAGDATKVEKAVAGGLVPTFATSTSTFDEYGRTLTSTDPDTRTATTVYTPATGAEPTSVKVADPAGLATATTYDPGRDLALTVTDPAGGQTVTSYDALGRPVADWTPGNPVSGPPVKTYAYAISTTAPDATTEQVEQPGGGYLTDVTINDSRGNVREVQQQTASGGSDVVDTTYDSDGWKALVSGPYYISAAPSGTLVEAAPANVPSATGYDYDGDGRTIRQISYSRGTETWETDTAYGGDYTTVVPPSGGTAETTFTDGRGLTAAIYQYHAGAPASPADPASDYDQTTYTYTPGRKLATITDAAGDLWSSTYNLLGDTLTQSDPDAGTTTSTYDASGQMTTSTDARGKTTSYTYDLDGRKTAAYDTTGGAAESPADKTASWLYDTLAKGKLTSSTSYTNGAAYTEAYTGYNAYEQPTGQETVIPSAQGALAGTYTQTYTYAPTGQQTSYTDPAAGGLPSETVTTGYDAAGNPDSLTGATNYVSGLMYTNLEQPLQYQMGSSSQPVYITDSYDSETGKLAEQDTQTGTGNTSVDDLDYAYDDVGDVTSEADTPSGGTGATEAQCFQYDYLNRLVQAWSQGGTGCAATPSVSAEGGSAPYWESYTYNTVGDLTGITSTGPSGAVTTIDDTYPAVGSAQPHAVNSTEVTTASGTVESTYGYDPAGELTAVSGPSQGEALTWSDQGQLSQVTITPTSGQAQDSSFVYSADGVLLLRSDPSATALLLGDEELVLNAGNGQIVGTRYYALGATTVASRTGAQGLQYLVSDQQNTASAAIDATTLAVARRYYDPYGNPIDTGAGAAAWPSGQKGFVGGTADPATGLTDLGAREYQPATGSFISPDSLLSPYDPQDLNAYAYAGDNPTTESDPTGRMPLNAYGCEGSTQECVTRSDAQGAPDSLQGSNCNLAVMSCPCGPPTMTKCPAGKGKMVAVSDSYSVSWDVSLGVLSYSASVTGVSAGDSVSKVTCTTKGVCSVSVKTPSGATIPVNLPIQDVVKAAAQPAGQVAWDVQYNRFFPPPSETWSSPPGAPIKESLTVTASGVTATASYTQTVKRGNASAQISISLSASYAVTMNRGPYPTAPAPITALMYSGMGLAFASLAAAALWIGRTIGSSCPDGACIE